MAEPFLSYAQNGEDIVLWRALRHVQGGTYVDVGAADPIIDSVTKAFYERGWRGVNVEPVPAYAAKLRADRPGDIVIEVAAGDTAGSANLHVFEGTGWSTVDAVTADSVAGRQGHTFATVEIPVVTLDSILGQSGFEGRPIHFLKVDVEGSEHDVLAGAALDRWRPWVVVVEATEPATTTPAFAHWEPLLLAAGYEFVLFDGLNRFYCSPDHPELRERLAYPVCVFDEPYDRLQIRNQLAELEARAQDLAARTVDLGRRVDDAQSLATAAQAAAVQAHNELDSAIAEGLHLRNDAAHWREQNIALQARTTEAEAIARRLEARVERLRFDHQDAVRHVNLIQQTVSWRVTSPLRAVRRAQRTRPVPPTPPPDDVDVSTAEAPTPAALQAFHLRLTQATALLHGEAVPSKLSIGNSAVEEFEHALALSDAGIDRIVWLALVTGDGRYPDDLAIGPVRRAFRRGGPRVLVGHVIERFQRSHSAGVASLGGLDVRPGAIAIDVGHTASYDLLTGIQRVVRETATRWFDHAGTIAVNWNFGASCLRGLSDAEVARFRAWREHGNESGAELARRDPEEATKDTLVPWLGALLVPELAAEPARNEAYRAMKRSGVVHTLSLVGYDLIPVTAAETVTEGMSGAFALYLAMVKHATAVSAISEATATELLAFTTALATSQGLSGPRVAAHTLPAARRPVSARETEALRRRLQLGLLPLVLVVGSHEPRKNHVVVLEAAERLWDQGHRFDLVFMGGSSWRSAEFDTEVDRMITAGRTLQVCKRVTEAELWAGYALADFTVFPSLLEGYGLPITESLISGTPVITSNFGSMAEIARGGGTLQIDPRDPDQLVAAMERLLVDEPERNRLARQARERRWKNWDEYASEVWDHLLGTASES